MNGMLISITLDGFLLYFQSHAYHCFQLHMKHEEFSKGFNWSELKESLIHFYQNTPLKPIGIVRREFNSLAAFLHLDLRR